MTCLVYVHIFMHLFNGSSIMYFYCFITLKPLPLALKLEGYE